MSADTAFLTMLLDGPMQSWGYESRFQRRTTGLYPTKSGVIGLICAAMGLAKGSTVEQDTLSRLREIRMTSIVIPRTRANPRDASNEELVTRRLEDFHTVQNTRRASGAKNDEAVVTRRQYLVDAQFGIILTGERVLLALVANALQDPKWGVWLGRKSCIPAQVILRGLYATQDDAQRGLLGERPPEAFTVVTEVDQFAEGTDSLNDQPVSFGDGTSSGPDTRRFVPRRVHLQPGDLAQEQKSKV